MLLHVKRNKNSCSVSWNPEKYVSQKHALHAQAVHYCTHSVLTVLYSSTRFKGWPLYKKLTLTCSNSLCGKETWIMPEISQIMQVFNNYPIISDPPGRNMPWPAPFHNNAYRKRDKDIQQHTTASTAGRTKWLTMGAWGARKQQQWDNIRKLWAPWAA